MAAAAGNVAQPNLPPLGRPLNAPGPFLPPDPGAAPRGPMLGATPFNPMVPTAGFQAPTVGHAPTPTPYGTFTAPDVHQLDADPTYQYDLAQQQKAIQRSAAARGTLLSGGLLKALQTNASGVAGQHYGEIYGRARDTYTTNRDTNAQNFGQGITSFSADTGATLDAGRLGFAANQDAYGRARSAYEDQRRAAADQTDVSNVNAATQHEDALAEYARQVALQRQRALAGRF
jgi:hypothetical protein